MYSKSIEEYKQGLFLTAKQKNILVGLLLGDGHLERSYTPHKARLKIQHAYRQREYVDWLFDEFREWVRTAPKEKIITGWGKPAQSYLFCTYSHDFLGKWREKFYIGREKIVPSDITSLLNPLSLAVWYMDDGSIKSKRHKGIFLNTQAFRMQYLALLQKALLEKFYIASSLRKDKPGNEKGFQIYIGSGHAERFIDLIGPYIISSLRYKIPEVLRLT